jgi:hypothetical protein
MASERPTSDEAAFIAKKTKNILSPASQTVLTWKENQNVREFYKRIYLSISVMAYSNKSALNVTFVMICLAHRMNFHLQKLSKTWFVH